MARRITLSVAQLCFCLLGFFTSSVSLAETGLNKANKAQAKQEAQEEREAESKLILEALAERYKKLGNWEAVYTQTEKSPGFAQEITSEGSFKFVNPSSFYFENKNPQLIKKFISTGRAAIYLEDRGPKARERYFARRFSDPQSMELERFLVFFRGLGDKKNDKSFEVRGVFNKPLLEAYLVPTGESDFSEIKITFHNAETYPQQLEFTDTLGGKTTLKIIKASPIKVADSKWFDLSLPKGATFKQ
jgi:outer membrane lipoprotein-sorting protein